MLPLPQKSIRAAASTISRSTSGVGCLPLVQREDNRDSAVGHAFTSRFPRRTDMVCWANDGLEILSKDIKGKVVAVRDRSTHEGLGTRGVFEP